MTNPYETARNPEVTYDSLLEIASEIFKTDPFTTVTRGTRIPIRTTAPPEVYNPLLSLAMSERKNTITHRFIEVSYTWTRDPAELRRQVFDIPDLERREHDPLLDMCYESLGGTDRKHSLTELFDFAIQRGINGEDPSSYVRYHVSQEHRGRLNKRRLHTLFQLDDKLGIGPRGGIQLLTEEKGGKWKCRRMSPWHGLSISFESSEGTRDENAAKTHGAYVYTTLLEMNKVAQNRQMTV